MGIGISVAFAFPIPAGLEDAVVLIEVRDKPNDSSSFRSLGTGFFLQDTATEADLFLITNRHVLSNRDTVFVKINLPNGGLRLPAPLRDASGVVYWRGHPDPSIDVAALPVVKGLPVKALERFSRARMLNDVSLGDEVYFVGFPLADYTRTTRNYPVLRHGVVSYISRESIPDPDTAKPNILASEMILIDATSLPGNSGSPVLSVPGLGESRTKLAGIIQGHLSLNRTGENLDLGIVIPTDRIVELIDTFR